MTALDREQLARVLGMPGSDHDGEVAAAGRQAERIRRQADMTWSEVLSPPAAPRQLSVAGRHWSAAEALDLYIDHQDLLSDWERQFVASICRRPIHRLSRKQRGVLDRLARAIIAQCGMAT
jgi:hypothetical protein